MAYTVPVVSYATTFDGTYTALTGIQSVQVSRGRRRFQDPFNQTTCVIELIPANSYATPLEVGQWIDVRVSNSAAARAWFTGRISDVQRDYAFPYDSGTGAAPADRITITALGAVGAIGQAGPALTPGFSPDARVAMVTLMSQIDVYMDEATGPSADAFNKFGVNVSVPSSNTKTYLDLMNLCANAGQAFIDDIDMERNDIASQNFEVNSYKTSTRQWTFSDTNTGTGIYKYTGITYLSGAQEAFGEVEVSGYDTSLTPQRADTGLGAPYNTLIYNTQLNTTANMLNLANYIVTVQNDTEPTPFVIRTNTLVADGVEQTCYMSRGGAEWFDQIIGATTTVEFRGDTLEAQVQGVSMAFYPEHANFEFYLSPFLGAAFTLDSTVLGVLDTNRLGYP